MKVTILGGTGVMGKALAPSLVVAGHQVTITGRTQSPDPRPGMRGLRADIGTGEGVAEAVAGAEVVVHLASDPERADEIDVEGTRRLLEQTGDGHMIYVSIVGVDRHPLPYYRAKQATEQLIERAGGLFTIVRATQWHDFLAYRVDRMTNGLVARVPSGYVYQPIDRLDVAKGIAALVESRPQGRAPDLAGPEVLGIEHLARTYMVAKGRSRPLLQIPKFGPVAKAFRDGHHTNPDRAVGKITWAEHLDRRFADS